MKIKVMEYNLLNGLFDKNIQGVFVPNETRKKAAQKIIKNENPDILILTEADYVKSRKYPRNYKEIFNFPYGFFASKKLSNRDFGIGILSKFPIIDKKMFLLPKSRWIKTSIKINNKLIHVDAIHPNPENNLREKEVLFKNLISKKKNPFIVAGDFNAIHPKDEYNKKAFFQNFFSKFKDAKKARKVVSEIFNSKTIKFLLDNNLIDTYKFKNKNQDYSYHTSLRGNNMMRIDYIFCSKEFKILNSGIIKNKLTEKSSDHYPILAELEI